MTSSCFLGRQRDATGGVPWDVGTRGTVRLELRLCWGQTHSLRPYQQVPRLDRYDHEELPQHSELSMKWIKHMHALIMFFSYLSSVEGILPKGPYLPCVSMAGRPFLAGYHRVVFIPEGNQTRVYNDYFKLLFESLCLCPKRIYAFTPKMNNFETRVHPETFCVAPIHWVLYHENRESPWCQSHT